MEPTGNAWVEVPRIEEPPALANGHGPDNIFQLFALLKKPLEVELLSVLADGLPARIRMWQPPPAVWAREGRSFPLIVSRAQNPIQDPGGDADFLVEHHDWSRRMLELAVKSAEAVVRAPDGTMRREWIPLRLTAPGIEAGPADLPMDEFDQYQNVSRCFTILVTDFNEGGAVRSVASGKGFREGASRLEGSGNDLGDGREVR